MRVLAPKAIVAIAVTLNSRYITVTRQVVCHLTPYISMLTVTCNVLVVMQSAYNLLNADMKTVIPLFTELDLNE